MDRFHEKLWSTVGAVCVLMLSASVAFLFVCMGLQILETL